MKFKAQGIKKHETSCKKLLETEEERQRFNQDYERGKRKGESPNCAGIDITIVQLIVSKLPEKKAREALRLNISKAGPSNLASTSESKSDASDAHTDDRDVLPAPEEQLEFDGNVGITSPGKRVDFISIVDSEADLFRTVLSDASMATINPAPAASAQLPSEFKTEFHPRSGRQTLFQPFDQFGISPEAQDAPIVDKEPWCPFRSRGDFEFSEIAIEAALNKSQINALLSLITRISEGHAQITLKNEADLSKAWDNAAAELTPVRLSFTLSHDYIAQRYS
jgi:hypothetical protein